MRMTAAVTLLHARRTARMLFAAAGASTLLATSIAAQQIADRPATHTVKTGDTLWDLAATYLGDPFKWPEIYRLNTDVVEDPHWIYPGEVLKLPGAVAPVPAPPPAAVTPAMPVIEEPPSANTIFLRKATAAPQAIETRQVAPPPLPETVRFGEFLAAPFIDRRGGPLASGRIIGSAEVSSVHAEQERPLAQMYDKVLISPPVGAVAPEKELYVSYVFGPLLEGVGQIVIPTGVIEVTRAPRAGEAGVARVVQMFGEVAVNQRLMAFDSSSRFVRGAPSPVTNGATGKVRWIYGEPALPSTQRYVIISLSAKDGVKIGDRIELYQPRKDPDDVGQSATPEVSIAQAQVVRVTPFAATAMVVVHHQPKIEVGNAVRVIARMP